MRKDKAECLSDAIEQALLERIREIYGKALESAIRKNKAFFQKLDKLDELEARLPAWYTDKMKQDWRQGFVTELMRQKDLIDSIAKDLAKAGGTVSKEINTALQEIYQQNRLFTIDTVSGTKAVRSSFALYDRRTIAVLLQETQSPFSKIAFRNLGNNIPIRRKLQAEMGTAILTGEGQPKMVKRIMKVAEMTKKQATRVAQTERTRIQSQARNDALQEAKGKGINVVKRWSARMVNTRESHEALNGITIPQGQKFKTIWGNELEYPGDPNAPAKEVINCHCIIVPDVVLSSQTDEQHPVMNRPFENGKMNDGDRFFHSGKEVTFRSWYSDAETIAGKGCKRKIDIIDYLVDTFGGNAKDWKKRKRLAKVEIDGNEYVVDIHWCFEPAAGYAEGKVKHDEYGTWYYLESEMYQE